jgi:hypothetical protein
MPAVGAITDADDNSRPAGAVGRRFPKAIIRQPRLIDSEELHVLFELGSTKPCGRILELSSYPKTHQTADAMSGIFVLPALGAFYPRGLNPVVAYSGQGVVTIQHVFVTSMNKTS